MINLQKQLYGTKIVLLLAMASLIPIALVEFSDTSGRAPSVLFGLSSSDIMLILYYLIICIVQARLIYLVALNKHRPKKQAVLIAFISGIIMASVEWMFLALVLFLLFPIYGLAILALLVITLMKRQRQQM
jgi:hypothetical protein